MQETFLAAWRGLEGFEGRASFRTWLYKIATNRCLNALRDASRRPELDLPPAPEPTRYGEPLWLQPWPDDLYEEKRGDRARVHRRPPAPAADPARGAGPARRARASAPPRSPRCSTSRRPPSTAACSERAPRWRTARRAPSTRPPRARRPSARSSPGSSTPSQSGDVDGIVALLTDDAWLTMPPAPLEYQGREAIAGFFSTVPGPRRAHPLPLRPHARERPARTRHLPRRRARRDRPRHRHPRAHARGRPDLRDHGLPQHDRPTEVRPPADRPARVGSRARAARARRRGPRSSATPGRKPSERSAASASSHPVAPS